MFLQYLQLIHLPRNPRKSFVFFLLDIYIVHFIVLSVILIYSFPPSLHCFGSKLYHYRRTPTAPIPTKAPTTPRPSHAPSPAPSPEPSVTPTTASQSLPIRTRKPSALPTYAPTQPKHRHTHAPTSPSLSVPTTTTTSSPTCTMEAPTPCPMGEPPIPCPTEQWSPGSMTTQPTAAST